MSVYRELLESFVHIEQHASAHPEEDILLKRRIFCGRRICQCNAFIIHPFHSLCQCMQERSATSSTPLPAKRVITLDSKKSFHCGCTLFVCLFLTSPLSIQFLTMDHINPVHHIPLASICIAFICYFAALESTHISFKIYQ